MREKVVQTRQSRTVMLHPASSERIVNPILRDVNTTGTFVEIDPVAVQEVRVAVVHDIAPDGRVWLDPEHVYPPEVREVMVADVVHVVELDAVVAARPRRESPDPAERNGHMIEVADFALQERDRVRVLHQHPGCFAVDQRPASDLTVLDDHPVCPQCHRLGGQRIAAPNTDPTLIRSIR
jgi:hypothetical protein